MMIYREKAKADEQNELNKEDAPYGRVAIGRMFPPAETARF